MESIQSLIDVSVVGIVVLTYELILLVGLCHCLIEWSSAKPLMFS